MKDLAAIHGHIKGPWIELGDFNYVLNKEKRLGSLVTMAGVREFRECVGKYGLQDLRFSGSFYTWNNK